MRAQVDPRFIDIISSAFVPTYKGVVLVPAVVLDDDDVELYDEKPIISLTMTCDDNDEK